MGFTINVEGGDIDKGDTKEIGFTPEDKNGTEATVDTIGFTATKPDGSTTTLSKSDFSESSGFWSATLDFDQSGLWDLELDVSDGTSSEVERDTVAVRPLV